MKLTNNRYYLDYNATTPLADSVKNWLARGVFVANPSSFHTSGKNTKKLLQDSVDYFTKVYNLPDDWRIVFHSGATEGSNTLIKGFANKSLFEGEKRPMTFVHSSVDHSSIRNQKEFLELQGHKVLSFCPDSHGDFDCEALIEQMKKESAPLLLNFMHVNNETGVVWDLSMAQKIKKATGCHVIVDSVQSAGKIENFQDLNYELDAYTFSGHKFGGLKGCGFTLMRKDFPFIPLMHGGGQMGGFRSGTENPHGIYSMKLAHEELTSKFNFTELSRAYTYVFTELKSLLGSKGEIVGENASERNVTTIQFIIKGVRSDTLMTALDMAAIEVSAGSACSSGLSKPDEVLLQMGYSEDDASSAIRFSFCPLLTEAQGKEYFDVVKPVLEKYL